MLQDFQKAIPNDNTELKEYISIWLSDMAETLKAAMLLYENDFTIQSISLCRSIVEAYFTLVWLYEEGSQDMRLMLLQYHLVNEYVKYQNKLEEESIKRGEIVIPLEQKDVLSKSADNLRAKILKKNPHKFSDEESLEKEIRNHIKSYPKIEDANKSDFHKDFYNENKRLYAALSGAVHPKDLLMRLVPNTSDSETRENQVWFYNSSMMLIDVCFTVLHTIDFVGNKTQVDMSAFGAEITKIHENGEMLIFLRYP